MKPMKKILVIVAIFVALLAVALFWVSSNLGRLVKASIERFGSTATQTSVTVSDVRLSLREGTGSVRGLQVHNPPGFSGPPAILFGEISVAIDPASVRKDKVVVRSLRIADGELSLVGGIQDNNLKQIAARVSELAAKEKSGQTDPNDPAANKRFQVDEFTLTGLKLNANVDVPVMGKQTASVTLPDVRLTNLGTGPEGITAGELCEAMMRAVMNEAAPALTKAVSQHAGQQIGGGGKKALEAIQKAGEIFKKH